jgi:hypothetical protein
MGARTDGALALVALAGFSLAVRFVGAPISTAFLVLGAVATLVFELLAFTRRREIYAIWDRTAVQLVTLALTAIVIIAGATFAPGPVLSAGIGALVAYLVLLAAVLAFPFVFTALPSR